MYIDVVLMNSSLFKSSTFVLLNRGLLIALFNKIFNCFDSNVQEVL